MTTSTIRTISLAVTLVLPALLPPDTAAAPKTSCTSSDDGINVSREVTTRLRRKPLVQVVETDTIDRVSGIETTVSVLKRGKTTVVETHVTRTAGQSGLTVMQRFGSGFRGIAAIDMQITGAGAQLVVDGRSVRVEGFGTDSPTLTFEDGQAPPTLRVKRQTARLLKKLQRRGTPSCPAPASAVRDQINDPFKDECETCFSVCFLKGDACFAGKIAACALGPLGCGAAAALEFFQGSVSCGDGLVECTDACNAQGHECCRNFCGGECCSHSWGRSDWVCAGANPNEPGHCCFPEDTCGGKCCSYSVDLNGYTKQQCADPNQSLCCAAGTTTCGNGCCTPPNECKTDPLDQHKVCTSGDPCGAFSCPQGQRCAHPSLDVDEIECLTCPADKTGPVCGPTCCAANEVCGFGQTCCTSDHLCGGQCCNNMANCLNGTTCCEPPTGGQCGDVCCPPLGSCCNGQCCAGVCTPGGICCAADRVCGSQCCPSNYTCDNGSCVPCGCAPTQECCPGGTNACCDSPNICCTPEGKAKGCYTVNDCLGLH